MKNTLELEIIRHTFNSSEVTGGEENNIGDFFIGGKFFCYTLEDKIRFTKVYGKTAISAKKYRVVVTYSPKFKRLMPLLLDVKDFSGIRLHGGNKAEHSLGCPLIAFNTNKVSIQGTAEKVLTSKLIEWQEDNPEGEIYITVKNGFLSHTPHWDK